MKRFRFDQILRIKQQLEEIKKSELARQNEILNGYMEKKLELEKMLNETKSQVKSLYSGVFFPNEIKYYSQFMGSLKKRIDIQNQLIYYQQMKVEEKRKELIVSTIEKKKYEKLKEKHLVNFMNELKRIENKELDRIISYKIYKSMGDDSGRK
ncbi:flagellar export protein FliJ [Caldicellulosiruptor naganoensis]|uniref:Flagellar FliJ protein n=1 Tax=Caldicellulosiruptor naganoensis TaxID=29324 RepID=A0ABY7BGZ0_9FIRM|nr:flagellar export protein FliJ [Caldicellulosiruptor naganoensis]WAM32103.1 flagellar export protein FliJ [Caldicellulosiruptor naganoensis]